MVPTRRVPNMEVCSLHVINYVCFLYKLHYKRFISYNAKRISP